MILLKYLVLLIFAAFVNALFIFELSCLYVHFFFFLFVFLFEKMFSLLIFELLYCPQKGEKVDL